MSRRNSVSGISENIGANPADVSTLAADKFHGRCNQRPFDSCVIALKAQQVCRYQPSCQGVYGQGGLLEAYHAQQAGLG